MKYLIISGNPKNEGLCHSVMDEIIRGATDGGADVETLTVDAVEKCRVCGDGWGTCREEHLCGSGDVHFNKAQEIVRGADLICIITPVYWGEIAEGLKRFLDKLRRCEFGQNGVLSGKMVLLVASPGGTGNGMVSCFEQMDRFCVHTGAVIFDHIGINRWNNDYKRESAYAAAKAMAEGRIAGKTI